MAADLALSETDVPVKISRRLAELEIKSVRQLYSRLQREARSLQGYLQLSDDDFSELGRKIENLIRDTHPEDMIRRIHPRVNKTGVAVHRFKDPKRPRYDSPGEK